MEEFAVGVVGGGWMASDYHLPTYDDHPATRIAAVAELEPGRRRDLAEQYGVPGYPTVEELLAGESSRCLRVVDPAGHERRPDRDPLCTLRIESGRGRLPPSADRRRPVGSPDSRSSRIQPA